MSKNKLHIFGCSHSTPHSVPHIDFWGSLIAKELNLELFKRVGQTGMGVHNILFDAITRLSTNQINKDDTIILNTSYVSRWSTINLPLIKNDKGIYQEILMKKSTTIRDEVKGVFNSEHLDFDILDQEISLMQWGILTYFLYNLLKEKCNNVYIWFLDDINEYIDFFNNDLLERQSIGDIGITEIWSTDFKNVIQFDNRDIIKPPSKYKIWDDFIKDNSSEETHGHMTISGNKNLSSIFLEKIKNSTF